MSKSKNASNGLIDIASLDKAHERALFTLIANGNAEVKSKLIESGISTVGKMAVTYISSEVGFDELFAAGCAAVAEAVHTFDCDKGERFISYLKRYVREGMKGCYDKLDRFLPIDYRTVQLHDRFELALLELYPHSADRYKDTVHDEEYLADYLGVTLGELRNMKNEYDMCRIRSLSESVKLDKTLPDDYEDNDIDNMSPRLETIVDPASENGAAEYLDELMDCLTDSERQVVCAREGVLSVAERTDGQIASELGIDENKVEVIYQRAIDKIKKAGR